MNLVAKEFIAARGDGDGVLVLSEFAGAAEELPEAMLVNPYSIEQLAAAMASALALAPHDRRERMLALRERVLGQTVADWVSCFTRELRRVAAEEVPDPDHLLVTLVDGRARADVSLVLMYEGVLVPDAAEPAYPDPELIQLLHRAGAERALDVHLVSSRDLDTLDDWFEDVPATIWAECGLWCREAEGRRWRRTRWISAEWMNDLRELLHQFTCSTPGALLEEMPSRLVWHFGRADRVLGRAQAQSLMALLRDAATALELDVREAERSIEVRPAALGCRATVERIVDSCSPERRVMLFHPWAADDEVRQALRPADFAVRVGPGGRTAALPDARAVRTLLWNLLATPTVSAAGLAVTSLLAPAAGSSGAWPRTARQRLADAAHGFSPA
jgi:trehalose 6-phosphate synthase/phosphatase